MGTETHAFVKFVDYTGSSWPVSAKAAGWDDASHIKVYYKTPSDSCDNHCVDVTELNFSESCHTKSGEATWSYDISSGHMTTDSHIKMNSKCNSAESDFYRAEITCQELGHIVGSLRHRDENSTSMHQNASEATQAWPDNHDVDTIGNHIYSHTD